MTYRELEVTYSEGKMPYGEMRLLVVRGENVHTPTENLS